MIRRILKESLGISQLLTCTSWWGIAKKKRFSMCREYGFTLWENPDLEASKLDDGWPESVEEQGLLLLVWRHHITKQYIKDVF